MSKSETATQYLMDTSALVEFEDFFDPERWKPVWDFIEDLFNSGRIKIIEEVYLELGKKFPDYKITQIAKKHRSKSFLKYEEEHFLYLSDEVMEKCNVVNPDSTSDIFADPMLLAVAGVENVTLVTHESKKDGLQQNTHPDKIKIPNHCETLGITDVIFGAYIWKTLLEREGFTLTR